MKHLLAVGATVFALVALAAGCGKGPDHNGQDVSFTQDMVPHHQQAITMTDMATAQTTNPQVLDLAGRIKAAQGPEISMMSGWLASWKEKATDHSGDMAGMAGMPGMNGLVSDADLRTMQSATGPEFDRLFLQRMTSHHQGAIDMAKVELDKGRFKPAKDLAREITTGQQKEIDEMAKLLAAPPAPVP